jgi:tetratricopeptide (TPR) repeat protein
MKKFFAVGIFWFIFSCAHSQQWQNFPDSLSGLSELQWTKSIAYLLELDRSSDHASVHTLLDYLVSVYNGTTEAGKYTGTINTIEEKALQTEKFSHFISQFGIWKATQNELNFLTGMVRTKSLPFSTVDFQMLSGELINYYRRTQQHNEVLQTLDFLESRKTVYHSTEWYLFLARANHEAGRNDRALTILEKASHSGRVTSIDPVATDKFHLARASVYAASGDMQRAERMVRQRLEKIKNRTISSTASLLEFEFQCYVMLSEVAEAQGDLTRAIRTANEYISKYAAQNATNVGIRHLEMLNRRAALMLKNGEYEMAKKEFDNLLPLYAQFISETDPVFIQLLNNLGETCLQMNQQHHAYVYLRWAYAMMNTEETYRSPLGLQVVTNLATVYRTKGDDQSAEQHLAEAASIRTSLP